MEFIVNLLAIIEPYNDGLLLMMPLPEFAPLYAYIPKSIRPMLLNMESLLVAMKNFTFLLESVAFCIEDAPPLITKVVIDPLGPTQTLMGTELLFKLILALPLQVHPVK